MDVVLEALAFAERVAPPAWRPRIATAARVLRSLSGRRGEAP